MTRRERVLAAIAHKEPDRVPVDLGAMRSTGMTAIAYHRLKSHLGIASGSTRVYDIVQQLAQPEPEVLDFAGADVVDLGRTFLTEPSDWKPFELAGGLPAEIPAYADLVRHEDGWVAKHPDGTVIGAMPKDAFYLSQTVHPLRDWDGRDLSVLGRLPELMDKVTWSALPSPPFHKPLTSEHLGEIRRRARTLYETTDYAVMIGFGGNLLEWGEYLCGMDRFLMDLAEDRPKAEALLDALTEMHIANIEKVLDAVEGFVQVIQMGDDLGTQLATLISPRMYREIFKPRHKLIYERVRRRAGIHLFLHSCGAIADIIPDLIEIGVEILNPVQTSGRGMEPARLKREFGKDIVFWGGGCDTREVLPGGTPDDVRRHVRERIEVLGAGGGFVFCQVHNILPNVPPANVVAMYEAVRESAR